MKVTAETRISFVGEGPLGDPSTLDVSYDNRGEPYRKGISLTFEEPRTSGHISVFLEAGEARALRDFIDKLYPRKP